jgi:hypothetical protein
MIYNVTVGEKNYKLELIKERNSLEIRFNNKTIKIDNCQLRAGRHELSSTRQTWRLVTFLKDNQPYELELLKDDTAYYCWFGSRSARCDVVDEKTAPYNKIMGD